MDQIKLYNILRNALKMADEDAGDLLSAMAAISSSQLEEKIQSLATKDDLKKLKIDLNKKIYRAGFVQFLALVASMLAIVHFMK
jgi:hypothetical protein